MTCYVALIYGNLTDSATITTAGSPGWSSSFPPSNLKLRELAQVARTVGTNPADTILYYDFGSAKTIRGLKIKGHNLSAGATVRLKLGSSVGSASAADSGNVAAWPFAPIDGIYDGSHFEITVLFAANASGRHATIALSDPTNPAGYLQVSRTIIGPAFIAADNPEVGQLKDGWMPANSTTERTENGAAWRHERDEMRSIAIGYETLTPAEASLWHEIQRTHKTMREVGYIPSIADMAMTQQYGFSGALRECSALDYTFSTKRAASGVIDEDGGAP